MKGLSTQESGYKNFPRAEPSLKHGRFPRHSSGWDTALPTQGAQVQSWLGNGDPTCHAGEKKKKLKNSNCRKAHWHVIQESIFLQAAVLETQ